MRQSQVVLKSGRSAWKGQSSFYLTFLDTYMQIRPLLRPISQSSGKLNQPSSHKNPGQVMYDTSEFCGVIPFKILQLPQINQFFAQRSILSA
jgi:hypothetical protein